MNKLRFAGVLILVCSAAMAARRPVLDDLGRGINISDPQISPDGRSIAVVVSRPNIAEDRFDSDIELVDVASGKIRPLTYDRKGIGSPRWSPSGDRLAFLANAGSDPQIFVLPMQGGEAVKVTGSKSGVQHFAWRPDGNAFAFAASDENQDSSLPTSQLPNFPTS